MSITNHKHFAGVIEIADEPLPEWISIYFTKLAEDHQRCNICEINLLVGEKSLTLLHHIKENHKEVHDLHKENPEATVGFRIEFLHLNVMKDGVSAAKNQPILICEAAAEEVIEPTVDVSEKEQETVDQQIVLMTQPKKSKVIPTSDKLDTRKRSWVWKYFHRMSNIIFRCNLCNVVLSIKGCNTNNMNRHVRTRHPNIYKSEAMKKRTHSSDLGENEFTVMETPIAVKTEEICASEKDLDDPFETSTLQRQRRSWIWMYFDRISATMAQCKLCHRNICHGGNATGNMNRHLKMIHHKTGDDYTWVWKVFETNEDDFYSCKICQYQLMKFSDIDKSVSCILQHLKVEHGVISGDQIITSTDECEEEEAP